jgi:hypothetical protein
MFEPKQLNQAAALGHATCIELAVREQSPSASTALLLLFDTADTVW